jgi:hypothetical protein
MYLLTLHVTGEDELDLCVGQIVWVLSKDQEISGDYGWWTGKIGDKVGIFPANYVTNADLLQSSSTPDEIKYSDLDVKEVIGAGKKFTHQILIQNIDFHFSNVFKVVLEKSNEHF